MVIGVGIDVVDVARFVAAMERTPALLARLFTSGERGVQEASLAARFAAKEALAKALGAPGGLHWQHAEVITDQDGRPWFTISGTVRARAEALGVRSVHVSLSHDAGIASAVVVLEG